MSCIWTLNTINKMKGSENFATEKKTLLLDPASWIGPPKIRHLFSRFELVLPSVVEKSLPKENCIVHRFKTNESQTQNCIGWHLYHKFKTDEWDNATNELDEAIVTPKADWDKIQYEADFEDGWFDLNSPQTADITEECTNEGISLPLTLSFLYDNSVITESPCQGNETKNTSVLASLSLYTGMAHAQWVALLVIKKLRNQNDLRRKRASRRYNLCANITLNYSDSCRFWKETIQSETKPNVMKYLKKRHTTLEKTASLKRGSPMSKFRKWRGSLALSFWVFHPKNKRNASKRPFWPSLRNF